MNKRTRRGKRNSAKNIHKKMRFLGVNASGLKSKLKTFKKVLSELKPSVFFIEETKYKESGKFKFENYEIFELVRKNRDGGGLAIGCIKELHPTWVREGTDTVESISIDIFLKNLKIRCCAAYGLQENDLIENKTAFWEYLDQEVGLARNSGGGFILHFDGNLWAGKNIIPGDPRPQNRNGKLFEDFLTRNPHLVVVNSLSICDGLITRRRKKDDILEESILDFFVVCNMVLPHITKMVIDERKKYILTNYQAVRYGRKATDSDHFTEYMDLDLHIIKEKPVRQEIYNFKNKDCQAQFKTLTSETKAFTNCFQNSLSPLEQVENWRKVLKLFCGKAFRKIRIQNKQKIKALNPDLSKLIDERNQLIISDPADEGEIDAINEKICEIEALENREIIMKNFKSFSQNPDEINLQQMWKLNKKLWPKCGVTLPTAKKNHRGKLVSNPGAIKKLLAREYKDRLRKRPLRPDFADVRKRRKTIFKLKMKFARSRKSPDWSMDDLETALKYLKPNKSRDFEGYLNEIFKPDVIGDNLKESILLMFNMLKNKQLIPIFLNFCNVTTVPKKGCKTELKNQRGIFRCPVVRSILMRLIYNLKYPVIDKNMSDCQMGARKAKGCRNNIFILNAIIHDVMKGKNKKSVTLQVTDYEQMFDAIDLEEAISDLFDAGVDDDALVMIHKANEEVHMAVKTGGGGLTEREVIRDSVLQGDTFGSILATVQVDSIGKECQKTGYGYFYKDILPVSILGLVDDMVGISETGFKAQQLNTFLNIKTAEKGLRFGATKCKYMVVGKDIKNVLHSDLVVDTWNVEYEDNLNTGEYDLVECYQGQVQMEQTDKQKYLGFVISNSGDNMVNIRSMKNKSIGIIKQIFKRLESLNLRRYYFECGMVFMNTMLRSSILYASETYHNLKENQVREIERIEENFMRKLLNTSRGCPITQLYLTLGQIPARFAMMRIRLSFLRYILNEDEDSAILRVTQLQLKYPTKGDWVSTCVQNLKQLEISQSFEEIKQMKINQFDKLLKIRIEKTALNYLTSRQGIKGGEMHYSKIEMSEYLTPWIELNILEKRDMFAVKNKMIRISEKFSSSEKSDICWCGISLNMEHIYKCEILNTEEIELPYSEIYNGEINEQISVFKRFMKSFSEKEKYDMRKAENPHAIASCEPQFSDIEYCNGFHK